MNHWASGGSIQMCLPFLYLYQTECRAHLLSITRLHCKVMHDAPHSCHVCEMSYGMYIIQDFMKKIS